MVRYVLFDGELVSLQWAAVLTAMRADGVVFNVNEGHRTFARQKFFWDCGPNGCCCCNNCALAAFPTASAPHIRTGRADHAIDFSNPEPVMDWLADHGLLPFRPAGAGTDRWEPWHIEVSGVTLVAVAKRLGTDAFDVLPKHMEHAVRHLLYHRRMALETKGRRQARHIRWRRHWRRVVVRMLHRARRPRYRSALRRALAL